MGNIITFYSTKGGQGKTTLALNYAIFSESVYYTNDYLSGTELLFKKLLQPNKFRVIDAETKEINCQEGEKIVFDFGGFIDYRIPPILKESDLCVIPFMYQSQSDVQSFYISLRETSKITNKILIVVNNTEKSFVRDLINGLENTIPYKVKLVNRSSYMTYLANEGITPFQIKDVHGVPEKHLSVLKNQLFDLFNYISEC
jgi:hypothetical protein